MVTSRFLLNKLNKFLCNKSIFFYDFSYLSRLAFLAHIRIIALDRSNDQYCSNCGASCEGEGFRCDRRFSAVVASFVARSCSTLSPVSAGIP